MTPAEVNNAPLRAQPFEGLESPFLSQEPFARQGDEWEGHLNALEAESPFLSAFEPVRRDVAEPEEENQLAEKPCTGIIGNDNRVLVNQAWDIPYRWICQISSRRRKAGKQLKFGPVGTGILISPRFVLTAAHLLRHSEKDDRGQWVDEESDYVIVTPARNEKTPGGNKAPFGRYEAQGWKFCPKYNPHSADAWKYDYAIIELKEPAGAKRAPVLNNNLLCFWGSRECGGNTNLEVVGTTQLAGRTAYTAGYPGDLGNGTRLYSTSGTLSSVDIGGRREIMNYDADGCPGQSGSPIWIERDGKRYLVGIFTKVATGYDAATGSVSLNNAIRITQEVFDQISHWFEAVLETPWLGAQESFEKQSSDEWSEMNKGQEQEGPYELDSGLEGERGDDAELMQFEDRQAEGKMDQYDAPVIAERDVPKTSTRVVAIGQRIELDLNDTAFAENADAVKWTIPGTRVRGYDGTVSDAKLFKLTNADLERPKIIFYWVDAADGRIVRARFRMKSGGLGQVVYVFDVKGPTVNSFTAKTGVTRLEKRAGLTAMRFGKLIEAPGITWNWKITMSPTHAGYIKDVQTVLGDRSQILRLKPGGKETRKLVWRHPSKTDPHMQLDGHSDNQAAYTTGLYEPKIEGGQTSTSGGRGIEDSPHTELPSLGKTVSVNDQFTYYIMFKPATDKAEEAIWVPIAKAKWFWRATANKQGENWVVSAGKMTPSIDMTTLDFPMYESNAFENEWQQISPEPSKEQYDGQGDDAGVNRRAGEFKQTEESDEFAGQDFESEQYAEPLMEELVPKVSEPNLRERIDEYFNLANKEYTLSNGTKVSARSQFHIASVGSPEQDAEKIERLFEKNFGAKFSRPLHTAIRCAAYGRARPDEIQVITQHLIDAGELDTVRVDNPDFSDAQLVRALQSKFNIGIDCAGYVQLAFIYAFTSKHDDARCNLESLKLREDLGLKAKRSDENLAALPAKHFTEVGLLNGRTADLMVLAWRKGERDWHTVIVVDHTVSGDVHTFLVDASWGFLYGADAAGVARRKLVHDKSTGKWWDIHPIDGTNVNENSIGPYKGHPIKGMYRAKEK